MKTQQNEKTRRWLSNCIAVSLLVWAIGALVWSGMPVQAQTTAPTQATRVDSSITIPVSGTVIAPDGTKVTVSGFVVVNCSAVPDETGALKNVVLLFDCSNVTATSGTGAKKVMYDTKGFDCTKNRLLQPTDVIGFVAPYSPTTSTSLSANTMTLTVTLNFNVSTGQLSSGSITVGNNTTTTNPTTGAVEAVP
ncbi:MAG TPA: hypothetical protein VNN73_21685 [Blastocatellia bacterium]|nr:hypothetical protein [Blastocatellia bacterium]